MTDEQETKLNTPVTEMEVEGIIKQMSNNKTPGPDGYPIEFYKMLRDTIKTELNKLYGHVWEGGHYFQTGQESYIKVLPKPGKDIAKTESYRPI